MIRLLIDADLMAYRAASGTQTDIDWGDTGTSRTTDIDAAKRQLRNQIDRWVDELDASAFTICLSDDFRSFRKERIDPSYKAARNDVERPEVLYRLKDWLFERFPSERRNTLEADDVMGIRATEPGTGETRIMVSQDKDMKTIPGLLYRPFDEKPDVVESSREEADRFHLWQTLTGDAVDGYPGCPGIGADRATRALNENLGWVSHQHELRSGPRRGSLETRWTREVMERPWDVVVSHYYRAGLTEADALTQARLARILRWEDVEEGRIRLWNPA